MGLAARPGRGVPAVHHAHETPADRRIPGWRTGPEPVGSAVPAVHVSAARRARLQVVRRDPQGLQHPGRGPWLPVDVRDWAAEETEPREVIEAALAHVVGTTRSRRRTRGGTCSSGGGASWPIGKPALPASARGCRRPPGGPNDSMPRRSRPRATPRGPCARNAGPGGSRANRFRAPTGGRVGIEHEPCYHCAGTTPRRWSAILIDGDRDALHRDRVVSPGARPPPGHAVPSREVGLHAQSSHPPPERVNRNPLRTPAPPAGRTPPTAGPGNAVRPPSRGREGRRPRDGRRTPALATAHPAGLKSGPARRVRLSQIPASRTAQAKSERRR